MGQWNDGQTYVTLLKVKCFQSSDGMERDPYKPRVVLSGGLGWATSLKPHDYFEYI